MKKRYRHIERGDKIGILFWNTDGVLFGSGWETIAQFHRTEANLDRCKMIVKLMNDCDYNS